MAGLHLALIVAIVCISNEISHVFSEGGTCILMDDCFDNFSSQANNAGNDRETYCRLMETKIRCLMGALPTCKAEQKDYESRRITREQQLYRDAECDATAVFSSSLLLGIGIVLALRYNYPLH